MKQLIIYICLLIYALQASAQVSLTLSTPRSQGGTVSAGSSITLKPGFSFVASSGSSLKLTIDAAASTPYASGAASFSQNQNYILTRTYKTEDGAGYLDEIQYFDGLGRPVQTVQPGITPSGADLVTYQQYDGFGRESNAWLPRPATGNNGAFVEFDAFNGLPKDVYVNDAAPFSYPVYESSPLNRVLEQYGPGQAWHSGGKSVKTEFLTNSVNYPCRLFEVGTSALIDKGFYENGELYVTKSTSEEDAVSYEFKDKLGQVVLTRRINGEVPYDTYYVYDDFGNLRYVLPPLAVDNLASGLGDNSEMMKQYAYVYKYDGRNRQVKKRLPGCDWMYFIYDKTDRLVLTQDGIQRPNSKWTIYKYDKLGRLLYTSVVTDAINKYSFETWSNSFNQWIVCEEFGVPAPYSPIEDTGYTKGFFKQPDLYPTTLLTVNYYDDYRFLDLLPQKKDNLSYKAESGYGTQYESAKGLLTGVRQYQLDDPAKYTITAYYYDNRGRVVQTKSYDHLGGTDMEYTAYDFTGHPTQKKLVHTSPQAGTQTELYTYAYDHAGRLKETRHQLNSCASVVLAKLTYDELGRVANRQAGGSSITNTNYAYNVRSWTSSISDSRFRETLSYKFDGNISRQETVNNGKTVAYDFTYDNLSRLTRAVSSGSLDDAYSSIYAYDKHGNINSISKNRPVGNPENISFGYTGNQTRKATNSVPDGAFADYVNTDTEYAYDANGAMTKDFNRGISKIQYNLLNLPQVVDIKSPVAEARNTYSYSADGVKLRVVQKYNSNFNSAPVIGSDINLSNLDKTKTTDYVGKKVFENGALKRILVDGGYIEGGNYYFYLADHLGNNRVVVRQDGSNVQNTDYYPYGESMAHSTGDAAQPYKFGGKEYDAMHGLNLYDFSARMQDPLVGRFTTVDPLAEKYPNISSYAYCHNNPVNRTDPTGMTDYRINEKGKIVRLGKINKEPDKLFNSAGKSITVSDKDILSDLSTQGKAETKNSTDAFNVFKFAADNSNPEWSLKGYDIGDKKMGFIVGTSYEDGSVGIGDGSYGAKTKEFSLHSHPAGTNNIGPSGSISKAPRTNTYESNPIEDSDLRTMLNDFGIKYPSNHYIYHEGTKQLIYYDLKTAVNKISQNERGRRMGVMQSAAQIRRMIIGR